MSTTKYQTVNYKLYAPYALNRKPNTLDVKAPAPIRNPIHRKP